MNGLKTGASGLMRPSSPFQDFLCQFCEMGVVGFRLWVSQDDMSLHCLAILHLCFCVDRMKVALKKCSIAVRNTRPLARTLPR